MKRSLYIFPLMAFTALSLTLAGCDDNTAEDTAAPAAIEESTMPVPADAPAVTETVAATITASNATAYATAEGARTGAVFLTLHNPQTGIDKLLGASTDKAATVEIHEGYVDEADGTMQMRKVENVEILPSQQVELKPGGYHIMLIDLAAPLVAGETFDLTLNFQNAGSVVVPVTITAPGASASDAVTTNTGTTTTTPADGHVHDDGSAIAPSTTTDVPVTEGTPPADTVVDEATPEPTIEPEVPADAPVTDEQPAQ